MEVCHGEVACDAFAGGRGDERGGGEEGLLVEGYVEGGEFAARFDDFDDDDGGSGGCAGEEFEVGG